MKIKCIYKFLSTVLALILLLITQSTWSVENQGWQERPILLGTSGSSINDSSFLYCCGGTLGCLVKDNNNVQYILSNNHVMAKTNRGRIGDDIIQPGLIDQEPVCDKDYNDAVADLLKMVSISFRRGTTNKVDAAIAKIRSGQVDTSGSILGIGIVNNTPVTPTIGMAVKKNGRTTGLTYGIISAIDVTVDVEYNIVCGVGSRIARFIGQIIIGTPGFSDGGDSGSLIVEGSSVNPPRPVGLLFAGGDNDTVANPINDVLSSLGVTLVGASSYSSLTDEPSVGSSMAENTRKEFNYALEAVRKIKERREEYILGIDGVVGIGIGLSATKDLPVIEVYIKRPLQEMKQVIPEMLEDIPVKIVETGRIIAF